MLRVMAIKLNDTTVARAPRSSEVSSWKGSIWPDISFTCTSTQVFREGFFQQVGVWRNEGDTGPGCLVKIVIFQCTPHILSHDDSS